MMLFIKQLCKILIPFCLLIFGILFQNCKAKQVLTYDNLGVFSTFAGEINLDYLEGIYNSPLYYWEDDIVKALESNKDPLNFAIIWDQPEKNMLIQFDQKSQQGKMINGPYKTTGQFDIDKNSFILNFKSRSVSENAIIIMEIILLEENSIRILSTYENGKQEVTKYKRN